ncbi:hypothetical protein CHARACLAT_019200 [Characodon lateralis]|uniref:Uncharacterized protein n=1 Tax=Characodon lateralis TaxID=208331 RepID=A0ABU7EKH2_9TELE|nr:hypothetical protein [Characodon lateralis]
MWGDFTSTALKLESAHQEPLCTDKFNICASDGAFLMSSHPCFRNNARRVLPGLGRKRTVLLLCGPRSLIQMKANVVFHLETRVWSKNEEAQNLHCLKFSDDLGCHVTC